MSAAKGSNGVTNVLIVGVGGQGVIMVSRVLAELSMRAGHQLKQSEVHGMAKRGGGVYSHVRFGEEVWSPTIPVGEADILLGLEWAEALRWLEFMRPEGGTFIADTQQIVPPFSCRDRRKGAAGSYTPNTPAEILEHMDIGLALDASRMAEELGNLRVSNTILLGALSTALEFAEDEWLEVLAQTVPPKTVELNHKAFKLGREWPEKSRDLPPPTLAATSALPSRKQIQHLAKNPENDVQWAVTDEWCKGCDICVKMCPERCLALDGEQVPRMENPEACTGCRICEWLCPDYAISVHTGVSAGAPAELPISERTGA